MFVFMWFFSFFFFHLLLKDAFFLLFVISTVWGLLVQSLVGAEGRRDTDE